MTNLIQEQETSHAATMANFAIEAMAAAKSTPIDEENLEMGHVQIRVGLHSVSV